MKTLLRLLPLILLPAASWAQDAPEAEAGDPARRYAVEIIVFSYAEPDSVGTEIFLPERLEASDAVPEFSDAPAAAETPAPDELRYSPLGDDEFSMQDTWGMLSRLRAYKPLMHFGWIQEAVPEATPPPLAIERFGAPPDGLAGTVSLTLSRYLHLAVDLTLAADDAAAPPSRFVPDDLSGQTTADAIAYAPLRYHLSETRILKSGETRYYDHPQFGVIAKVTRVDES